MPASSQSTRNDGTSNIPGYDSDWSDWVSAGKTRNWCLADPILDWLDLHGEANGYAPDKESPGYDGRTDFTQFIFRKGSEFEAAIVEHLGSRHEIKTIAEDHRAARSLEAVEATWEAMAAGVPVLAQAPIWNPEDQTYGIPDLLVRSDVLIDLFPGIITSAEAAQVAPDLPSAKWHYRVVDIKFTTLDLLKDGHAASGHLTYMAQVWIYNAALGRLQGFEPPSSYLLGRAWKAPNGRGTSAMERLSRVDQHHVRRDGTALADVVAEACDWIRRVRQHGAGWQATPTPTVDELRPNIGCAEDYPWHGAKRNIADELRDLTILPRVNPAKRQTAIAAGVCRWDDPQCFAAVCDVTGPTTGPQLDAVIQANHSADTGPIVFPGRVSIHEADWRDPRPVEFFVDFETVSDLDDDFSAIPDRGGQSLIFMVGCGHLDENGEWIFRDFTTDALTETEEHRILTEWIEHVRAICSERGCSLEESRFFHWSPAELSFLITAYNSAAARHGLPDWNGLPWVDLLARVFRAEPVTVRGAFGFGLKAIAKAMNDHGLIATCWGDGPADGLGAMVGAWWCDREAGARGCSMRDLDLMSEIRAYNEVDCKVMAEILEFLEGAALDSGDRSSQA